MTPYRSITTTGGQVVRDVERLFEEPEDTLRWAQEDEEPFLPVAELPVQKPDGLSLYRFIQGILP